MALSAITASSTALSGLGLAAFNEGKKFESAFAGVKKTVEGTEAQFEALRQGILDMSERMPESAADIASVAEAAGQLGIATDNILDFTETMTMLGTATNLTADEAATSLARFANITQMSPDNFDKLGATIVALGNNFATTESEIVAMATRIASTGEIVGLSETEIMALAATLSSLGIEADAGGSAISKAMKDIEVAVKTGNGNLENYASVANMTVESFSKLWESSPVEALDAFVAGLNDVERNGSSAIEILDDMDIKEIRMSNSLLALSTSNGLMTKAVDLANTAWKENTALTNEAAQRYETLDSKLAMLKSSAQNLGIYVYEGMEVPLKNAADKGIEYISQLQKAFKTDGLRGLVTEFSNIFVDILTFGAEKAPDFFKMGSDFLMSIANGIRNNSDRIFDAFVTVLMQLPDFILTNVSALFSIGSLFVDKLAQGIGENADNIGSAAADLLVKFADFLIVNIPKLASAAAQIVKAFAKEIGNQVPLLKPFTKILELAGTAVEKFGTEIGATIIAVMSFKKVSAVTSSIGKLVTSMKNASKGAGLLKTAISSLGSPITLAIAGVGALAAAMISYSEAQKEAAKAKAAEKMHEIAEAADALTDSVSETAEMLEEIEKNAPQQLKAAKQAGEEEAQQISDLVGELDKYVDANGRVKEGYEDRVGIILGDLANATGSEISQIEDGVIPAYQNLKSNIEDVIEKKKALALVEPFEDDYAEWQQQLQEYGTNKVEATQNLEEVQKGIDAFKEKYQLSPEEIKEIEEGLKNNPNETGLMLLSSPELQKRYQISTTPLTLENEDAYKKILGETEEFYSLYDPETGLLSMYDTYNTKIAELDTSTKQLTYDMAALEEAQKSALEGDYDATYQALSRIGQTLLVTLDDVNSSTEDKQKAVQDAMLASLESYKMAMENGATEAGEDILKILADTMQHLPETGLDMGDEWVLNFLSELAEIDGFDTTQLMSFIGQTGTEGGKLYGQYVMNGIQSKNLPKEIKNELESTDAEGAGINIGSDLGMGIESGVLPHINAVSSMISGLQSAASTLSSSAEMAAFKIRQAQYEQSQGGSGGGSTTINNTYNGAAATRQYVAQQSAAHRNSVQNGYGGGSNT